jgi:hypothetical protein
VSTLGVVGCDLPLIVKRDIHCMDVDSGNTDKLYWEKVLRDCGLSMSRGKHLKTKTNSELIPVGGSAELDAVESRQRRKETGRVTPGGHGPDD